VRSTSLIVLFAMTTTVAADDADDAIPRHVDARLEGTSARLNVKLTFDLAGGNVVQIPLPTRAVVIAAVATIDGATRSLALVPALADSEESTLGSRADRGWMIYVSGGAGAVWLETLAPHAAHLELDLELEAPTCFYRDARYLDIPPGWRDALDRDIARTLVAPSDELAANCARSPDLTWIAFPSSELVAHPRRGDRNDGHGERLPIHGAGVAHELARIGDDRIAGHGERLALDATEHIAHVELDLARELGTVPPDLYTALVIDASRSRSAKQAEIQRAIVQAYLQAAPRGHIQVIAYARTAHALLPAWSLAGASDAAIDRAIRAIVPRNGSNADAGLAEAAAWLSRVRGTRRVIVFSDGLPSMHLGATAGTQLAKLLPAGTLVHAVTLDDAAGELARDDDATFAELANATAGMAVRGGLDEHGDVDATMLARPIALDRITVAGEGWETLGLTDDECDGRSTLREGGSCSWWGDGDASSGPVTIEAMIWGRSVVRTVDPARARALSLARTLTAITYIDGEKQLQIETAARAVSSAWSLLARWGGDGYGVPNTVLAGRTALAPRISIGQVNRMHPPPSGLESQLETQLEPVVATCNAGGVHVRIYVEITCEEIVDVQVEVTGAHGGEVQLRDCVTEGVWNTMLSLPDAPTHTSRNIEFGAH
jgi:hypothetical protein